MRDIYDTPLDVQKPYAILKNKPKLRRGEQAPVEEEPEEVDDFFAPANQSPGTTNRTSSPFRYVGRASRCSRFAIRRCQQIACEW